MKLAVTGSRTWNDPQLVSDCLDALNKQTPISLLIHGGADGADDAAWEWARKNNIPVKVIRPDYRAHNPRIAPLRRNDEIVDMCDKIVAFWDGISKGTYYTMNRAGKMKKPLTMCFLTKEIQLEFCPEVAQPDEAKEAGE